MNAKQKNAKLLHSDMVYLRQHSLLPDSLINELTSKMQAAYPASSLEIDREFAEPIRGALTERLAVAGFDQDDEPNEEGRFIEDLIDRLFIP